MKGNPPGQLFKESVKNKKLIILDSVTILQLACIKR